jgi:hypothetical protein
MPSAFGSACSDELTNEKATELVSALPVEVMYGRLDNRIVYDGIYEDRVAQLRLNNAPLVERGILTVPQSNDGPDPDARWITRYRMAWDFTDSARVFVLGSNSDSFLIKCGELRFDEVTSIFQEKGARTAEIEYSLVPAAPTMFENVVGVNGNVCKKEATYTRKKIARKYDTGWAIEE